MQFRDVPDMLLATILVFGVALVATNTSAADSSFGAEIEGTYEAVQSESKARTKIDEQLQKVIQQMFIAKRPFAWSELREATDPCERLVLAYEPSKISIQCDDLTPAVAQPDGTQTSYTEADGTTHDLTQTVEEDRVVQVFESEDGRRTNTYRLKDDETLVLDVRLESSQLPEPITYSRTFERK